MNKLYLFNFLNQSNTMAGKISMIMGIVCIVFGILVLIIPQILVALIAVFFMSIGMFFLNIAWHAHRMNNTHYDANHSNRRDIF